MVFCGGAIALYWPAVSVGFLSDDYVLVTHASTWTIGPVTPSLFRPLPLLLWALLLHAGGEAATLHLLNVLLHGTHAYLTTRVVSGWVDDRRWSFVAGLLMLTAPLAPEAVVWLSGVFDLMAAALILTCILIARRYADHPALSTRIQFVAVGLAAVASKETAAIAGGLVLLDAWVRKAGSRQLFIDTGVLISIVGIFSLVRLASAFGVAKPPVGKYEMQRAIFGSFGGLAVPWHIDVIRDHPWLPIVGVLIVVLLLTAFLVEPGRKERTRLAVAGGLWVLISIVPIFPILFIATDLQQSRYLYLPVVGWAALIVVLASEQRSSYLKPLAVSAVGGLIVISVYGTVLHLRPWNEAALLRDRVEVSARNSGMDGCPSIRLSNLPDSVRGAYVFRNGGSEAFARDLRLNATLGNDVGGQCTFRWSETRLSFVRSGTE